MITTKILASSNEHNVLNGKKLCYFNRGLLRRQTNTEEHDPETCRGEINDKCPIPHFEAAGAEVMDDRLYKKDSERRINESRR